MYIGPWQEFRLGQLIAAHTKALTKAVMDAEKSGQPMSDEYNRILSPAMLGRAPTLPPDDTQGGMRVPLAHMDKKPPVRKRVSQRKRGAGNNNKRDIDPRARVEQMRKLYQMGVGGGDGGESGRSSSNGVITPSSHFVTAANAYITTNGSTGREAVSSQHSRDEDRRPPSLHVDTPNSEWNHRSPQPHTPTFRQTPRHLIGSQSQELSSRDERRGGTGGGGYQLADGDREMWSSVKRREREGKGPYDSNYANSLHNQNHVVPGVNDNGSRRSPRGSKRDLNAYYQQGGQQGGRRTPMNGASGGGGGGGGRVTPRLRERTPKSQNGQNRTFSGSGRFGGSFGANAHAGSPRGGSSGGEHQHYGRTPMQKIVTPVLTPPFSMKEVGFAASDALSSPLGAMRGSGFGSTGEGQGSGLKLNTGANGPGAGSPGGGGDFWEEEVDDLLKWSNQIEGKDEF